MTAPLKLYSTSSCHLCEQAAGILSALTAINIAWEEIEISENEALLECYGTRIPVLRHSASGVELDWPFTETEVIQLVSFQAP
ncbi:hypothetical protein MTYP_00030 [Methylophilaceae bacterium]|nr:hypothetical protein MTYP_00030 [Methylophilaceae bacterium]